MQILKAIERLRFFPASCFAAYVEQLLCSPSQRGNNDDWPAVKLRLDDGPGLSNRSSGFKRRAAKFHDYH